MKKKTVSLFLLACSTLALGACAFDLGGDTGGESKPEQESSQTQLAEWVDYAKNTKLTHDYNGKSFLKDGIGEVTLVNKIDGDTAHFKQVSGDSGVIKGRYNCIDTPESTGMLEPWGHGASEYNGKLLKEAKHIVLTTDKADGVGAPALDSTGGRYLIYVWVTTEEFPTLDDFVNVNLALCQEGWSKAKGTSGKEYADAFISASVQAQNYKKHVWSDDIDPDFNYADPVKITLADVVDGKDSKGQPYDWNGSKVTFEAYVTAVGPDKGACYVTKDFEKENADGTKYMKKYGMYIFTQYIEYSPLQVIGNELEISGTVSEYNGTLQLVDVSYSEYYHEDGDIKILSQGNEDKVQPLTGNAGKFASDDYINTVVSVDLVCTGGYATVNTATTTAYSFTLYCHDKNNPNEELNIRISDALSIKYPDTLTRIKDDIPFFKGEKTIAESTGKGTDNRKVEYISITGGLVKYVTTTGKVTYQVNLCKVTGLTLHMSEK